MFLRNRRIAALRSCDKVAEGVGGRGDEGRRGRGDVGMWREAPELALAFLLKQLRVARSAMRSLCWSARWRSEGVIHLVPSCAAIGFAVPPCRRWDVGRGERLEGVIG